MAPAPVPRRLLVVDDDPASLLICKTHLKTAGHDIVLASSVQHAREELAKHGIETFAAVLTDYRMPVEDGLVLLNHITAQDPSLAVVIITAEGEKNLVMSSLRQGAQNFIEKPIKKTVLLDAASDAIAATQTERRLRADANAAHTIGSSQRLLLGMATEVHNERLRIRLHPHEIAGGDFVATFQLDPDRFVILISDVSGHDLRAAYHSAYLQGLARGLLQEGSDLSATFGYLNTTLLEDWNGRHQVDLSLAACAICMDHRAGSLTLMNCGMPNPVFSDPDGWVADTNIPGASPLGWFAELPATTTHSLGGGLLNFWSDGLEDLAERLNVSPLALSYRLQQEPSKNRALLANAADDIVVGRLALSADPSESCRIPLVDETYPAGSQARIDSFQGYFEHSLRLAIPGIHEEKLVNSLLCLRESLLNALEHGCGGAPLCTARVRIAYDPADSSLWLCVSDTGPGHNFDSDRHESTSAEQLHDHHRGLIMIKHLSDQIRITDNGKCLLMTIHLSTS